MSSGSTEQERQSDWILPASVDASGNPNCIAVATSTSVVVVDLASISPVPLLYDKGLVSENTNPLGHYLNLQAQSADAFCLFGPSFASVSGANAPAAATTNTVNGSTGVVTMAKTVSIWIPQGQTLPVKLPVGSPSIPWGTNSPYRFVALVTSTSTGIVRIWQSSP